MFIRLPAYVSSTVRLFFLTSAAIVRRKMSRVDVENREHLSMIIYHEALINFNRKALDLRDVDLKLSD